jgi:hypothetical protein
MRNLIVLVVVALVAWYGWHHLSDLRQKPRDVAVVENQSGRGLTRVRLTVGGHTDVRDLIPDGGKAEIPLQVTGDGTLALRWQFDNEAYDKTWSGGEVSAGPLRTRHHIQVMSDGGVVWTAERITAAKH